MVNQNGPAFAALVRTARAVILADAREGTITRQHAWCCPTSCAGGCDDDCVVDHDRVAALEAAGDDLWRESARRNGWVL